MENISAIKQEIVAHRLETWTDILNGLETTADDRRSVVRFPNSSTYVFSTGRDTFWLVDPAFCRDGEQPAETREIARLLRRKIDFIIISHLHADHCQMELAALLADSDIQWIIPETCADAFMKKSNIPAQKITQLRDGQQLVQRGIAITARHGFHKDPVHFTDIPAAAYDIKLPDGVTLFLPGDIRDFQATPADDAPVDNLFAHVFLGRDDATGNSFPLLDDYCRFIARRPARHIILAHLYEVGRAPKDLWTHRHADMVAKQLAELAPASRVTAPHFGDVMTLE